MSKLLIVDDEQDVREFAKNFFVKRNIDVRIAPGGAEALKLIDEDKPDLVLLDVRMGDMTGIEVLQELRAKGSDVKVIMVTGVEDQDVIDEAKSLGVVNYVHKPLALDELEQIVLLQLN